MALPVQQTLQLRTWLAGLTPTDRARIVPAIEALEQHGPSHSKRLSKPIKSSRHPGVISELRSVTGNLRVLYGVDQDRAVLLIGGDKTNNWRGWYRDNVVRADRLWDQHLRSTGRNGPWREPRTGEHTSGR